jgi:hypothetical protein
MPKAPAAITSPKIKKLAQKALKSPSMLTTEETSVMAYVSPLEQAQLALASGLYGLSAET